MADVPSEIILDILSRMPVDPDPCIPIIPAPIIILHQETDHPYAIRILGLSKFDHKEGTITELEVKKDPLLEFNCPKLKTFYIPAVVVQSSCNGWLFLSLNHTKKTNIPVVAHPLRKECYKVPRIMHKRRVPTESCGLGFDASTNTYKIVCVLPKRNKQNLYTMVHVVGTNSWRRISQVPSYPITGESIFAHGRVYWLVVIEREVPMDDDKYTVIWFDVMNEEFGSIDPPRQRLSIGWHDELVNINGEVGFVSRDCDIHEVWVLKQEEWVIHCRINENPLFYRSSVRVVGFLNKTRDVLITYGNARNPVGGLITRDSRKRLLVYKVQSGVWEEVKIIGHEDADWDIKVICI